MSGNKILVLGVGNILLADEGVGVHTIRRLQAEYDFSPEVKLVDGGTLGISLMEFIQDCDNLILIDAVRGGHAPGSVYRLEEEGLRKSLGMSDSMHQVDLVDTLIMCELASGKRPSAVVFGMEPKEIPMDALNPELSAEGLASQEKLCKAVIEEVERLGGKVSAKN